MLSAELKVNEMNEIEREFTAFVLSQARSVFKSPQRFSWWLRQLANGMDRIFPAPKDESEAFCE